MATKQTTHADKSDTEQPPEHRSDVPGSYFGTDGEGNVHYWQSGTRTMTLIDDDADDQASTHISEPTDADDKPLVDWGIHILQEQEAYWDEVRVREPYASWLEGRREVGDFGGGER